MVKKQVLKKVEKKIKEYVTLLRQDKLPIQQVILFGSYAKGTQTKSSDIDVMVICPDGREDAFEKGISGTARSLPLPLHPLVFSESQFLEMAHAKEPNVGQEALKNNVVLYGIEQYYGMI